MSSMKPREPGSLKEALDRLIAARGGLVPAAESTGGLIGKSLLHRHADPDEPRCALPLDVLEALEAAVGEPTVSLWLIRRLGWEAFPVAHEPGTGPWHSDLAEACRDSGEAAAVIMTALADGNVDREEAGRGLREVDRTLTAWHQLRGRLLAVVEGEE